MFLCFYPDKIGNGTTAKFDNYGGTANFTKVEIEPFGQSIQQNDPEEPPQPPPNDPGPIGGADDPHWQCEIPSSFQPYHCNLKAEIANSLYGTGFKTIYDPEKKPGDPNFINVNDPLPAATAQERRDDRLINEVLYSSGKPQDVEYGGAALQSTSIPNGCNGDVDLENNIVNIRCGGPSLPDDFKDASFVPDIIPENKNGKIKEAIANADTILSGDNTCSKFFIENAAYGKESVENALKELDKILVKDVIDKGANPNKTTAIKMSGPTMIHSGYRVFNTAVANQYGAFFDPTNKIRFGSGFPKFNGYAPDTNQARVLLILHELAHMVLDDKGEPLIPDDKVNDYKGSSRENTHKILEHCKNEIDKIKN